MTEQNEMARRRALRYLGNGPAAIQPACGRGTALLRGAGRAPIAVPVDIIAGLAAEKAVRREGGLLVRNDRAEAAGRRQIRERRETPGGIEDSDVDAAESPLGLLRRLKGRHGEAFLAEAEFRAGERLRIDYTKGNIMPRLGANWEASVASSRRAGGMADLTDAALAARLRVERAIGAVGPELSGLLIDICCFLKGLEQVERERDLPQRSAKVLLKAGLASLARHYEPDAGEGRRTRFHWGTADFRPAITP
ncbi:MAG: hypothetical protein IPL47_16175 [Phyllobacteriaceae bacterium]|nr:hypothetical protein [Phyllobacteriaceae bacterium]